MKWLKKTEKEKKMKRVRFKPSRLLKLQAKAISNLNNLSGVAKGNGKEKERSSPTEQLPTSEVGKKQTLEQNKAESVSNEELPNEHPIADAGKKQVVKAGSKAVLDGTRSTDADGKIVSYVWTQVLGPKVIMEQTDRARSIFTSPSSIGQETSLIFKLNGNR